MKSKHSVVQKNEDKRRRTRKVIVHGMQMQINKKRKKYTEECKNHLILAIVSKEGERKPRNI